MPGMTLRNTRSTLCALVLTAALVIVAGAVPAGAARTCGGKRPTLIGSTKSDFLAGTPGPDVITTGPGHDQVYGRGGDDVICSGRGDDFVVGGPGDDRLLGERGIDDLVGDEGNDDLRTGDGPTNTASGGVGDDKLTGGSGLDLANYLDVNVAIEANLAGHTATGEGTDTFDSIEGVLGSRAGDTLTGDEGPNLLVGAGGDDSLSAGGNSGDLRSPQTSRVDILVGDGDPLVAPGSDLLQGAGGVNVVDYTTAQTAVNVDLRSGTATGDGADRLVDIQIVSGSEFDDILTGNDEDNGFRGYQGNDTIQGAGGNDVVVFTTSREGVTVDLTIGSASGEGFDSLTDIENIWGSYGADQLTGSGAANSIFGLRGADRVAGEAGDDSLHGGPGSDALDGGDGTDSCRAGEANTTCENDRLGPPTAGRRVGPLSVLARETAPEIWLKLLTLRP